MPIKTQLLLAKSLLKPKKKLEHMPNPAPIHNHEQMIPTYHLKLC